MSQRRLFADPLVPSRRFGRLAGDWGVHLVGWRLLAAMVGLALAAAVGAQPAAPAPAAPARDLSPYTSPDTPPVNSVVTENLTAHLVAERTRVVPGTPVDLALVFDIRPHWHTYWRNPGDSGEPPRLRWELPAGVSVGPIRWPPPELIPVGPLANYGYSDRAVHLLALEIPADWPVGEPVLLRAEATWLVCEEFCVPERGTFALQLDTAPEAGPLTPRWGEVIAATRARLPAGAPVAARFTATTDALALRIDAPALLARLAAPTAAAGLPATDVQTSDQGSPRTSPRTSTAPPTVRFFAGEWGLIDHAAPQQVSWANDDLILTLAPGELATGADPSGLLVVTQGDRRDAFEVQGLWVDGGAGQGIAQDGAAATSSAGPAALPVPLGLPLALLFAFLGGLVLNLMPCVFPVLAIKALGLARQGGAPFAERALHGLAYTAGVLTFFAIVAGLLLALRAGGAAVGWGFQLQSPVFVALMAYLFLVLGLSLAGGLVLGTQLMGLGASADTGPGSGHRGAFITGGLAALVAAPCTAPFMGAALGYAVTLPWALALLIILTLGLGLAAPFLLLALLPQLARRLPRPGAWMETLKQLLAFPMFATAAWLVWVLAVQLGADGVAVVLAGMLALAFGLWLIEHVRKARAPWSRLWTGIGVLAVVAALWLAVTLQPVADAGRGTGDTAVTTDTGTPGGFAASPYSAATLRAARAEGRAVFVNMTAAWCITCLVNERVALSGAAVAQAFAAHDLLYLKGDWTNRDPAITEYLAGFGRNGVPIYVLYPPDGEPQVLPQLLTEAMVLAAIANLP